MSNGRWDSLASVARWSLVAIAVCIAVFQVYGWLGLRLNVTPSLPIGVYIVSDGGKLVEFCPSEPFALMALRRGYRVRGICPDGGTPLLKPVVATSGDVVVVSAGGIAVNGICIPGTAPLSVDSKGRPLSHWPFGRYVVDAYTLWVVSSYDPRSFDSRYFGPISTAAIRNRLKALVTL